MDNIKSLMTKKIAGIPILYLVGLGVTILAIIAFKMTPAEELAEDSVNESVEDSVDASDIASSDYGFAATRGTVVVTDNTNTPTSTAAVSDSNELWVRRAAEWLSGQGYTATDALRAMSAYVEGQDLSYEQGQMRDKATAQLGLPPENITPGGTKDAPAKRQGSPPCTHTVKGSFDNSYTELSRLYYNRTDGLAIDLLQRDNVNRLGHEGPWPVGTTVKIPKWQSPKYTTAKNGMNTLTQLASKNGVTKTAIMEMNDGMKFPAKNGTKVRVA
jgi:hypothetical protein